MGYDLGPDCGAFWPRASFLPLNLVRNLIRPSYWRTADGTRYVRARSLRSLRWLTVHARGVHVVIGAEYTTISIKAFLSTAVTGGVTFAAPPACSPVPLNTQVARHHKLLRARNVRSTCICSWRAHERA